jgi:hypothetical protein
VTTTPDPRVAAEWMAAQINEHGELYQYDAAEHIAEHFGGDLTYENDNGNLAISRKVLAAFRSLTEGTVVWEQGAKLWRRKDSHDPEGRLAY